MENKLNTLGANYRKLAIAAVLSLSVVVLNGWGLAEFITFHLTFYFGYSLIESLGRTLPIRELTAFIYVIQILLGAVLTYEVLPIKGLGAMKVSAERYYAYAVPCVLTFVIGLYFPAFKYTNVKLRNLFTDKVINKDAFTKFGLGLVAISFGAQFIAGFGIGQALHFIFSILFYFRFVGFFYIWLSGWKYRYVVLAIVFLPFVIGSLGGALFIDLFVMCFLTFAIFQIKRPLTLRFNVLAVAICIFLAFILQAVKMDLRKMTWGEKGKQLSSVERLTNLVGLLTDLDLGDERTRKRANIKFVVRINQGFIVSWIMRNMPERKPFVNGSYFKEEVMGIFLPRLLYADKAVVGDHKKFERLTGVKLSKKVAMSVSILGDGYGNFGYWGGILFCFLNGVLLNFLLHLAVRAASRFDATLVLWIPLIFFFAMRCGDEFYIITNHIIKSSLIVYVVFLFSKHVIGLEFFVPSKKYA